MKLDFSASIITGGVRTRVENTRLFYADGCKAYFDDILSKRGKAFAASACGFLLLDSLLQKHKINRLELVITLDESGRPRTNRADLDFSISHSEGCAACAVLLGENTDSEPVKVGIDIQHERPYSLEKMTELARAFMNDEELGKFSEPSDDKHIPLINSDRDMEHFARKNKQFYTAWTHREALAKREGADIFDNLKTAKIADEHFRDGVINSCGERYYYAICAPSEAFYEPPAEEDE